MGKVRGYISIGLLFLFASSILGQGSAGGYGQGGGGGFGGGGFGGGQGGGLGGGGRFSGSPSMGSEGSQNDKRARPEEDPNQAEWVTKSAVLTPGDAVEFKLEVKKGETLFASATSDAFDPALSVVDSKKKELAKNDDRVEGDQSPFLIYRFPVAGTYTLKVLSYRSVSGGKFTAKMRTFVPVDAELGKFTAKDSPSDDGGDNRVLFRIACKKNRIYDLRSVEAVKPVSYMQNINRIIGPSGVESSDLKSVPTSDGIRVFEALKDGDYYLEYGSVGATQYRTNFVEVPIIAAKANFSVGTDIEKGELKIFEMDVTPNLIVRTTVDQQSVDLTVSAPAAKGNVDYDAGNPNDTTWGSNRILSWYLLNRDSHLDVVRVFHGTGKARFVIRSNGSKSEKLTFKNSDSLPAWSPGEPIKGSIGIGEAKIFSIRSAKSELMRVAAKASYFEPKVEIFRLTGELANTLLDRKNHKPSDDLYFPEANLFIVRLTCDGFGGSGEFEIKRDVITTVPYALGTNQTIKFDGVNFGLYGLDLIAGKRYQLTTDQPGVFLRADLLDEDGQFLVSQSLNFDKVNVQYFVPTRSGKHRLWLRGTSGERKIRFEAHVPPGFGGG